jgi:hypothetical protein
MAKAAAPWLLLIHQIPKDPAYLRVKVGRRLAAVGAVALKNSVYALPNRDACREDFSWLRREILDGGGEAGIFEASSVEGFTNEDLERTFREARASDYEALAAKIAALESSASSKSPPARQAAAADLARIEEQLGEVERIDFFSQHEARALRARAGQRRSKLDQRSPARSPARAALSASDYQGRTWVTRTGAKVDRVACAWLIQRHIDAKAKFRFVELGTYSPRARELRFDMPEGEFTHEGDLCSFEVLCSRFALVSSGLGRIAEIVHDLDVKDGRYGRPETEGVRVLIQGLVAQHASDVARIEAASTLFDALLAAEQPVATSRRKR